MRLRSQKTKLLSLPDELLSTIILETMWATTTRPTNPPDLLLHERRLTNHPSLERREVAFVGQICEKLRRIAQSHLMIAQLWHDPGARVESHDDHYVPIARDAPSKLMNPSIGAIACSRGQAVFLPKLRQATLEHLSNLSVSGGDLGLVFYSDDVLRSIGSCKQLRHLVIDLLTGSASGTTKLLADIASIPTLQGLSLRAVYNDTFRSQPQSLALRQPWSPSLVRLEMIWCETITLSRFVQLMGKVAATLQVAIFHHNDDGTYSTLESFSAAVASFPQLWRLDIGFGYGAHPLYRNEYPAGSSTPAGRQQLAECSPIAVWKAAPRLEYFECSEQIVVKTQKELDEISGLRKREGMRRLRIKLETWEGDKGAGWSPEKIQEVVVG